MSTPVDLGKIRTAIVKNDLSAAIRLCEALLLALDEERWMKDIGEVVSEENSVRKQIQHIYDLIATARRALKESDKETALSQILEARKAMEQLLEQFRIIETFIRVMEASVTEMEKI